MVLDSGGGGLFLDFFYADPKGNELTISGSSFTYKVYNTGLRTEPCGTPTYTGIITESWASVVTQWVLFSRYVFIHAIFLGSKLYGLIFVQRTRRSFCIFALLPFCLFAFLYFCRFVFLSLCHNHAVNIRVQTCCQEYLIKKFLNVKIPTTTKNCGLGKLKNKTKQNIWMDLVHNGGGGGGFQAESTFHVFFYF